MVEAHAGIIGRNKPGDEIYKYHLEGPENINEVAYIAGFSPIQVHKIISGLRG